jgi:hypothetical protein
MECLITTHLGVMAAKQLATEKIEWFFNTHFVVMAVNTNKLASG